MMRGRGSSRGRALRIETVSYMFFLQERKFGRGWKLIGSSGSDWRLRKRPEAVRRKRTAKMKESRRKLGRIRARFMAVL